MSDITFDKIQNSDVEDIAMLISSEFTNRQVSTIEPESDDDFVDYLKYTAQQCVASGLGFVAKSDGNIVGGLLCVDLQENFGSEEFIESAKHEPMLAMIYALNQKYFPSMQVNTGEYLNFKFIAVHEDYAGKGISQSLIQLALKEAELNGFSYVHTESAGFASQHIFKKAGLTKRAEIKYDEFTFGGKELFQAIK